MEKKEERRKSERRTGRDRRSGEKKELYQRLIEKGTFQETRKAERRRGERRTGEFRLSQEEKYAVYAMGLERKNRLRVKAGLAPEPLLSFKEWSKQ